MLVFMFVQAMMNPKKNEFLVAPYSFCVRTNKQANIPSGKDVAYVPLPCIDCYAYSLYRLYVRVQINKQTFRVTLCDN